jgi:hypothetical protein
MKSPCRLAVCLLGLLCPSPFPTWSAAWVDPAQYLVLEPKQGPWQAQWIDPGEGIDVNSLSRHVNTYAVLFDVANAGRRSRIAERLFTDSKVRDTTVQAFRK